MTYSVVGIAWGRVMGVWAAVLLSTTMLMQAVSYINFEQVTVANSSIGFTATKVEPNGTGGTPQATIASCRLETAEIRYQIDGTAPTTTVGTLLEIGDILTVTGHDSIMRFRAIRTGATSGVLSCTYSQP